jgi:hypothetical protein
MEEVMLGIATLAPHFSRIRANQRYDGVVGKATTLDAMIIEDVAESVLLGE